MTDEQIDKLAGRAADIVYATFTNFYHSGAKKPQLVRILKNNILWVVEQIKDGAND